LNITAKQNYQKLSPDLIGVSPRHSEIMSWIEKSLCGERFVSQFAKYSQE